MQQLDIVKQRRDSYGTQKKPVTVSKIETEKIAFRRLISGIQDPDEWESFVVFLWDEVEEQGKKKKKYSITGSTSPSGVTNFFRIRAAWLLGLMLLQSFSGIIMDSYSALLNQHIIVATFVTTLIGTGGNAGNQAGSLVLRGITTGEISADRPNTIQKLIRRETTISLMLAATMSVAMFFRAFASSGEFHISIALSISIFFIVLISIMMGSFIPIMLSKFGFDPASGAAPILATCMDLVGVTVACVVCNAMLFEVDTMNEGSRQGFSM